MIKLAACCGYIKEWRWWKGTITRAVESPDWIYREIGLNVQIEVKAKLRRCLSARARKIIRRFSISASNHIRLEEFNRKISTTPPFLFLLRTPICLCTLVLGVLIWPLLSVRFDGVYTYRGSKWAILEELFADIPCLVDSSRKCMDAKGKIITACTK
jgi:hypothetical protein